MKIHHLFLLGFALFAACKNDEDLTACEALFPAGARFFEFVHVSTGDTFYAWTTDTEVISRVLAELALPQDQRSKHINGKIARVPESCDLNKGWSWYFVANEWDLVEVSIELCDGNPRYVEENLEDYLAIDRYCPWSSVVKREIDSPF